MYTCIYKCVTHVCRGASTRSRYHVQVFEDRSKNWCAPLKPGRVARASAHVTANRVLLPSNFQFQLKFVFQLAPASQDLEAKSRELRACAAPNIAIYWFSFTSRIQWNDSFSKKHSRIPFALTMYVAQTLDSKCHPSELILE